MQSVDKIYKIFRGTRTPASPQKKSTAFNPSSEAGVQIWQWFYSPGYGVSAPGSGSSILGMVSAPRALVLVSWVWCLGPWQLF
jgi:hypothetical protein